MGWAAKIKYKEQKGIKVPEWFFADVLSGEDEAIIKQKIITELRQSESNLLASGYIDKPVYVDEATILEVADNAYKMMKDKANV